MVFVRGDGVARAIGQGLGAAQAVVQEVVLVAGAVGLADEGQRPIDGAPGTVRGWSGRGVTTTARKAKARMDSE